MAERDNDTDDGKRTERVHIRLYDANVYDDPSLKRFTVQLFALDDKGNSYSLFVSDYEPFFYANVPNDWSRSDVLEFGESIRSKSGVGDSLICIDFEMHHKLYGYDARTKHQFVRLSFRNMGSLQRAKRLWFETDNAGGGSLTNSRQRSSQKIRRNGFEFRERSTFLYEAHIPPLLRMYHILNISPSGWVHIPADRIVARGSRSRTTCDYEGSVPYQELTPDNTKENRVPYKICSFDIEASSSHGDFPLPVKSFRKLASEIVQYAIENDTAITAGVLVEAVELALSPTRRHDEHLGHISPVYLKETRNVAAMDVPAIVNALLRSKVSKILTSAHKRERNHQMQINDYFKKCVEKTRKSPSSNSSVDENDADENDADENDADENDADENDADENDADENDADERESVYSSRDDEKVHAPGRVRTYNVRQPEYRHTLLDFLNMGESAAMQYYKKGSKKSFKEDKIAVLDEAFVELFPCGVKGDEVTFIGSVFFNYGEPESYLNHCIVLNTCDDVPNATIERYSTEADVLQAWKRLILREDPDVILGYNIFGFDYEFMFRRAIEQGISYDFLTTLSKNRGESCYTQNRDGIVNIAEQKIVLASGEHNLSYIKMSGRIQVDLFNLIRRDYNLPSYKLDYVAGHFIGDRVRSIDSDQCNTQNAATATTTTIRSKNLTGLYDKAYVCFEVTEHSTEMHNNGEKFMVYDVRPLDGTFELRGVDLSELRGKDVRWCLAKDDVTPQDIFRLTDKGPSERAQVAKYCIQDCRLPMHIFNKIDAMTSYIEMSKLCSVPISFIVMRGQGIKLTSYMAKKCRDMGTLIPSIGKSAGNEAYEGAIVLEPKCDMYLDTPISCVDYGSLYPSSMISENISHDTKASTKEYNLDGDLIFYKGKEIDAMIISKGIPYRDITYDTYRWVVNPNGGKAKKKAVGRKTCRYVQPDADGVRGVGIIPAILKELLAARKATRKQIPLQTDLFMKNVLDKRQLSIKVTANSIYGQCGAKTSTFYDMDVAASTTAIGRELLIFARDQIESKYADGTEVRTDKHGVVKTHAKCVYGDTDSAFVSFGLTEADGETPVVGRKALELSIALGEEAGEFVTRQLKTPHVLEYEKTFMPFCLLSKKRYVGMLYETDPDKCERKSMGIVLKRRDNAPIVKDVYGGIIDILMKTQDIDAATRFLNAKINGIIAGQCSMQKLVITKSLRSNYANPKQIAHKVLADRIAERDPGNAPRPGDRVAYVHVHVPMRSKAAEKALLTGDKIELPAVVLERNMQIDYGYYLTNQIMKPVQQLFALVLEKLPGFHRHEREYQAAIDKIYDTCFDSETFEQKRADTRAKLVKKLMFDPHLTRANNAKSGQTEISSCFLSAVKEATASSSVSSSQPSDTAPAHGSTNANTAAKRDTYKANTKTQPKITSFFIK